MKPIPFITTKYLFRKVQGHLREIVSRHPEFKTALDAPAGHGALTQFLSEELKLQTTAVDLYSPQWMYPEVPLKTLDMGRPLPFPDQAFDLVICMEGLKHFTDISTAISEMARVLKNNGILFLTIPNDLCMQSRLRYVFDGFVDTDWRRPMEPGHINEKEGVYVNSLTSLPYLYYFIEKNGLSLQKTDTCHLRFWSVLWAVLLYPIIFFATVRKIPWRHPLRRQMLSMTWLAGRRNILICRKSKM